jgi:hypothetical protein
MQGVQDNGHAKRNYYDKEIKFLEKRFLFLKRKYIPPATARHYPYSLRTTANHPLLK